MSDTVRIVDTATGEIVEPLSEEAARRLTNSIKAKVGEVWKLLLEAHDRQAWKALGYSRWQDYVEVEFAMTRGRAYQLLDQGRTALAITEAAGASTTVDITEREARDVKPHLAVVTNKVRDAVTHETTTTGSAPTPERTQEIVDEAVQTTRQREVRQREARASEVAAGLDKSKLPKQDTGRVERERKVIAAIQSLADTEDPDGLAEGWSPHAAYHLDRLDEAAWVLDRLRAARRASA